MAMGLVKFASSDWSRMSVVRVEVLLISDQFVCVQENTEQLNLPN